MLNLLALVFLWSLPALCAVPVGLGRALAWALWLVVE